MHPMWIRHPEQPFSIMATEVAVSQFKLCVESRACREETFDPKCNYSAKDKAAHPMNCVSFTGAEQYCASVGGRICEESEWLAACRGSDDRAFPYGEAFDLAACNAHSRDRPAQGRASGTTPVGALDDCQGGLDGLYDLSGNVHEWVGPCKGDYCKFRGGAFLSNEPIERFAGCRGVCAGNQRTFTSGTVGFRCCRDELH